MHKKSFAFALKEKVDIVKSDAPPKCIKCLQMMCCSGLRSADVCVPAVDGVRE